MRVGPGIETLRALPDDPPVDFAFVDADKPGYPSYYEELLRLMRPGALMVLDNVLLGGRVLEPDDESSRVMADLNERIARLWAMVADLDPELARRLSRYQRPAGGEADPDGAASPER